MKQGNFNSLLKVLLLLVIVLAVLSCNKSSNKKTSISSKIEGEETSNVLILKRLEESSKKGILFGHQDDLAYGIGWKYKEGDSLNSDVKKITGSFPAILGWDLGGIGNVNNLDQVPFIDMRNLIIKGDSMGAINTLSWHPFLPNDSTSSWDTKVKIVSQLLPGGEEHVAFIKKLDHVADFFDSLKDSEGNHIEVVFRPWHEMNGNWFWWGEKHCSHDEYKNLFRFTVDYLRGTKHLKNLAIAYSPDRMFYTKEDYLQWYPGDTYVDILGVDNYWDFKDEGDGLDAVVDKLEIVIQLANEKGKIAALSETGDERLEDTYWYTQKLGKSLSANNLTSRLAYVLVWRNHDKSHFYVPYVGHDSERDFLEFTQRKDVLLLNDIKK